MITIRGSIDFNKMIERIVDDISDDLLDELKSATPVDSGQAAGGWILKKSKRVNTITNKVPYISELEKGHSSQAPTGMTKPAIDKIIANAASGKYKRK